MEKIQDLKEQFQNDFGALKDYRNTLDEREKFLLGRLTDSYTQMGVVKPQVNSQTLLVSLLKRTNNVMAQLPTGVVRFLGKKDKGKSLLMNLILEKYILPNARSQFDIYTKFWLMQFLSTIYGAQDVLIDYIVSSNYIGPDFQLIPRRLGIPEAGKVSIDDCDRYWVISYVTREFLERKRGDWKQSAINKILEEKKGKGKPSDSEKTSFAERDWQQQLSSSPGIEIITKYEKDKWTIFSAECDVILKEMDNPFGDGELPIVSKLSFPLLDRYMGLSLYDLMISAQKGENSLINLFLAGLGMRVYPPLKVFLTDIVASSLKYEPGAIWALKNANPNAVTEMQFSGENISNFNNAYQTLKAIILNGVETSDTTIAKNIDLQFGKTPQALKMQQAYTAIATNFDRKMLEGAIEKIYDKFINLLMRKQVAPIKIDLFSEEIKQIESIAEDVKELVEVEKFESGEGARVILKPLKEKGAKYKFFIDAGSTSKKDQIIENQTLTSVIELLLKIPGAADQIAQSGKVALGEKVFDFGEALKRWLISAGLDDWEKIVKENERVPNGQASQVNFENLRGVFSPQQIQEFSDFLGNQSVFSQNANPNTPPPQP